MWIEDTVDRESQQKLYVQMYTIMKGKIAKGEWLAGMQVPTEDGLCKIYDVSKATIRHAISELVRDGYLRRLQGKGTFVTYSPPRNSGIAMKTRLTEEMLGEGVNAKKEILSRSVEKPSRDVDNYLRFSDDVYCILCRRMVENTPAYLEQSFIPVYMLPQLEDDEFCGNPLYDLIQTRSHRRIFKVVQTIEITEARDEIAAVLRMKGGSPVLLLHRLLIGADRNPLAYTRLFGSGRQYKLQTEFERIK
ncbi:MAG: GntR family transcriptional regulator [Nitrospirae bacterium]|nr:GntR family transcriptional regulator [Nitrospirota bacterium]